MTDAPTPESDPHINDLLREALSGLIAYTGDSTAETQQRILEYIAWNRRPSQDERTAIKAAIRNALTEEWRDVENCRGWTEDVLLTGCRKVGGGKGYEYPEQAADIMAGCAADAILARLRSPAPEWRPVDDWRSLPDIGRKFIALYSDGSGAVMFWRHDHGFIDHDGNEHQELNPKSYDLWSYIPNELEFWCETGEEPMTLSLPVLPTASTQEG